MNKLFKVTLFLCLIMSINTAIKAQQYAVKSGYVEYELSGNTKGTKKIWWDNYGQKSRTEIKSITTAKMFGITSTEEAHTVSVIIGKYIYSANLIEGTGQKATNPYYDAAKEMAESMTDTQKKQLEQQIVESLNAEKQGSESLLGNTCDIYKMMGAKSWIYKGVVLKSDANVMGIHNIETATKFDKNIAIPSSKFEPDNGVEYQNIDALQQQIYGAYEDNIEDDDEAPNIPVKYPFNQFEKVVNGFSFPGYIKATVTTMEGQHIAMFMQGMASSLTIAATSKQNDEGSEAVGQEEFMHNGHKCKYGNLDDDDGTALLVDYPAYDMYIVIAAMPERSKAELLKISDKLNF